MKFSSSIAALALLFASSVQARYQPSQHDSWNIVISGDHIGPNDVSEKIVEIDLENYSASQIQKFHDSGKKVICYFSAGTLEVSRPWASQYKKVDGLVRNTYEAWDQERWLDYRVSGYKDLVKQRLRDAVTKKCDAVDPDNLDGYQVSDVKDEWSHPLTKDDAIKFASWLGQTAHEMGLAIGLKNCLDIVDTVGKYFDFAINEGCQRRDECKYYYNFLNTGKPVFAIAYGSLDSNRSNICRNIKGHPFTFVVKPSGHLKKEQVNFDPSKYCGSGYSASKVDAPKPKDEPKKVTTTVKKTTTVTKTTTVNKPVVIPKPSVSAASTKQTPAAPVNQIPASTKQTQTQGPAGQASTKQTQAQGPAGQASTKQTQAQGPASQGPAKQNPAKPAEKNGPAKPAEKNGPAKPAEKNGPAKQAEKEKPVVEGIDGENQNSGDSNVGTGIAISGSVLGAAAVFAFLKKNPKKAESIKRGISRRATSIKRGASTISRRVTTRRNRI